jgi:hypothetical protein
MIGAWQAYGLSGSGIVVHQGAQVVRDRVDRKDWDRERVTRRMNRTRLFQRRLGGLISCLVVKERHRKECFICGIFRRQWLGRIRSR